MELPREIAARQKKSSNSAGAGTGPSGVCPKAFNMQTYKLHALGDYVSSIKMFGTTDSYTTQIGELAHRLLKRFYQSTNKQDPPKQLAKQEWRRTRIRRLQESGNTKDNQPAGSSPLFIKLSGYHHQFSLFS
ncbi:hypothetical protein BDR06DRAFT_1015731 [Suillus hirtellus]|nr:hypothetical protein BDR06DRAFT_1015731 [Suillus hirtellus]